MRTNVRRFGFPVVLGVVGSVAMLMAPGASAAVTGVSVAAGPGGLRAGCTATVTATVDAPPSRAGEITIINSGDQVPVPEWLGKAVYHPESRTATFKWIPKYAGRQNITAQQFKSGQYTSAKYITVDVQGRGGRPCPPLP